ncbi:MAG TPA: hypothetical protein DCR21_02490 [Succinivibrionaceae bacterium]|nr:hypothetical protein [Succinivibrionaceae bacterium]
MDIHLILSGLLFLIVLMFLILDWRFRLTKTKVDFAKYVQTLGFLETIGLTVFFVFFAVLVNDSWKKDTQIEKLQQQVQTLEQDVAKYKAEKN